MEILDHLEVYSKDLRHTEQKNICDTSLNLESYKTLFEFFESNVDRHLDCPALISEDIIITYGKLDELANQLANLLHSKGIGVGDFVGIYLDRSIRPIIAILATLKAGAAYIPLDPSYPQERISYIVKETKMSLVLSEKVLSWNQLELNCPIILLDDLNILNKYSKSRLNCQDTGVTPESLCYILFTSGTTGRPKGIMTEHRNVVSFAESFNEIIQLGHTDRVYQGFSLGFDGSVEEMWMAFSNGAALVIGNPIAAKLPDEASRIMNELKVTVFSSVPTFLGLIKHDIPSLRLVILSGEKCPESLVDTWSSSGTRVLNVYGPTETTVNTTAKECLPGQEITIGTPLRGYETFILNKQMKVVPLGEYGELYIGGVGVSRGYYNRDDFTQKAFIYNPFFDLGLSRSKKLYKTGDKVCQLDNGELQFFGRLDTQVKIRGFRVELSEIESVLTESPLVNNALVCTFKRADEHLELAAFIIPVCEKEQFDYEGMITLLKARLPSYMIPTYLDLLDGFPMLASGKANRSKLPKPIRPLVSKRQNIKKASGDIEVKLVEAFKKVFKLEEVSVDADFFSDLAGYSLLAVETVSLLRAEYGINISVREVYQFKTIEEISKHVKVDNSQKEKKQSAKEVFQTVSKWERYTCVTLQALFLIFFTVYPTLYLGALIWVGLEFFYGNIALWTLIYIVLFFILFGYPLHILISVGLKWVVIGKYRPGRYPLWSMYYLRWWLATRIQASTGIGGLVGTPLYNIYLRLMGAKVGKDSIINSSEIGCYDLIEIGSNTCIGAGSQIYGSRVEDGMLVVAGVIIGDNCFVGDHCCLALNSKMGNDSNLEDLSLLPDNAKTQEGTSYAGSPAVPEEVPLPNVDSTNDVRRPIFYSILHLLAIDAMGVLSIFIAVPLIAIMIGGFYYGGLLGLLFALLFDSIFGVVLICLISVLVKKIIMPQTPTGIFKVHSLFYVRKWMMDKIFGSSVSILHSLYTTIYLPTWLRMMGAKIGKLAEISTVSKMTPDLTTLGEGSFLADGSMIGGLRLYKGHIQLKENKVGSRSFVGNNAHLSTGKDLGDNCLLGVISTAPQEHDVTPPNSEWLGTPSFALPYRKKVTSFDISSTFKPTFKLYVQRCIIDGLRILIPNFIALAGFANFVIFLVYGFYNLELVELLALWPLMGTVVTIIVAMIVVVLKKMIMGTFRPVIKPLWCVYVWCNELINGIYETVGVPLLSPFMGTPFFNWYLRLLGCKIGKHAYIGTTLFSEWDLVEIGDYCSLNAGVVVQNHLFEDRVMKSSYVKIADECSVGNMSIVLYDSEIQKGTNVGPLSLVMKGDNLPKDTNWIGIPISKS
ncbi:MAG: amino acid adenylation domain-containing protein [Bacteriovoracaceae bacterium]|nr:amino acid adenylation domain-containing protein [Bacteriovoracaceae bacterium]